MISIVFTIEPWAIFALISNVLIFKMQEKVFKALSVLTIVTIIGYMTFQYLTMDNNPHLRRAYSGKMELYHAAQLATKYERLYEEFLNGRRWPGSHFGMLKLCPSASINDTQELLSNKNKFAKTFLSGKGVEIGEPLLDWSVLKWKVAVKQKSFVPSPRQSSFASKEGKGAGKVASTEHVLSSMRSMSVDFLIANGILQRTEHTIAMVNQMLRVVRRQGFLLLVVPNACYGNNRHRVVTDWHHFEEEYVKSRRVVSNHEEHLNEWALSHLSGHLPNNSSASVDQIVAGFRSPLTELELYDYHTWDHDSMMEFLAQARSVLEFPYAVRESAFHEKELVIVLQKL